MANQQHATNIYIFLIKNNIVFFIIFFINLL